MTLPAELRDVPVVDLRGLSVKHWLAEAARLDEISARFARLSQDVAVAVGGKIVLMRGREERVGDQKQDPFGRRF